MVEAISWHCALVVIVFILGYVAIIFETVTKVNKTAIALLIAVLCWMIFLVCSSASLSADLAEFGHDLSEVSQIIFFLMGAMTLVELIDSHRGFKRITDIVHTTSKRKMMWIISFLAFFLSSVLDNLTTTILMVSLLRKLVPEKKERFVMSCLVVIAANAGGAWTPIGDVTTTMLWINGQLSSLSVMKALFLPSIAALIIPLLWFTATVRGKIAQSAAGKTQHPAEPGAATVFCLGLGGLICVPVFKALTGLPPFMGVILALALLWLVTDLMHYKYQGREHLRVPHILTRVDTSGILFFLGILLCINALQAVGFLQLIAHWLNATIGSLAMIATLIGLISAVIDNVPLVAATMGMYPLEQYPIDSSFWHMIAYAAGTGGSILIIGSSSGVALMGLEKIDFLTYLKKATLPIALGYLGGMAIYLFLN